MSATGIESDMEFQASTVEDVRPCEGGWTVDHDGGWILFVTNESCPVAPNVGEAFLTYGRGIGSPVRGIVCGGRVYRYETAEQQRASFEADLALRKAEKVAAYESERAERDRRASILPEPLRRRMERFQRSMWWRVEHEPYELMVCEEAAKIARHCGTVEAVAALHAKPWGEQAKVISSDHSGNSAGAAFTLAALLLRGDPDLVIRQHGALCPLVGCRDYGCWAAEFGSEPPQ
jgi:hypothetical protein